MNIETIKDILIPVGTLIVTWFSKDKILHLLNVKKEKNEVDNTQLENVQKALDVWQDMLDDAVKRHRTQVNELELVIEKVKQDLKELNEISEKKDKVIKEQRDLIEKQSRSIKYYIKKYESNNNMI